RCCCWSCSRSSFLGCCCRRGSVLDIFYDCLLLLLFRSAPLRPGRRLAGLVVAGRRLYSARHVGHHPGSVYRRAAQTAIMTAVTGVDTAGAMARKRRGVEGALSYHGNRDRLHTAIPDIAV
ncbi:MAG: hypothetical protein AAF721_28690, partial [Myxococcota bacterium]